MKTAKLIYDSSVVVEQLPVVRRILHPTALTDASSKALAIAVNLARQTRAELLLAHALPPPTPIFEIESFERPAAEAALETLVRRLSSQGIKTKRVLIKGSRPIPENIAACAKFFSVDMIVMGTQSRRGLARLLRGSLAGGVIKVAPCPVLVVKNR